jgi:hypothetical protein
MKGADFTALLFIIFILLIVGAAASPAINLIVMVGEYMNTLEKQRPHKQRCDHQNEHPILPEFFHGPFCKETTFCNTVAYLFVNFLFLLHHAKHVLR